MLLWLRNGYSARTARNAWHAGPAAPTASGISSLRNGTMLNGTYRCGGSPTEGAPRPQPLSPVQRTPGMPRALHAAA